MKTSSLFWSYIFFFLILLSSCFFSNPQALQPDKQPYQFQNDLTITGNDLILADLDSDGFTEIITVNDGLATAQHDGSFLLILTFEGKTIDQVNYDGKIISKVCPIDYDGDGSLEILVPFVRNDSLFVSFVNNQGDKLVCFFLINGKPRIDEDGSIFKWDPQVREFYVRDLNNDGINELITVITTLYARLPRGVLVNSLPQGKLIGKQIVGSSLRDNFLDDFDSDGKTEILCFGTAPDNGANAGGFDDQHSYLINFDLTPQPLVSRWKQMGERFSNYYLFYTNVDEDDKKELIGWTEFLSAKQKLTSKIVELNPVNFTEIKKRSFNSSINCIVIMDLDRDSWAEIVAIRAPNEIIVLDNNFDEKNQRTFPFGLLDLKTLPDVDNDGFDEIVVGTKEGDFFLDHELKIKAFFPGMLSSGIIRRGATRLPQIVMKAENGFAVVHLIKNRFYFVKRYYAIVLGTLGIILALALGFFHFKMSRRNYLLKGIQSLTIDCDGRGFLIVDCNGKIYLLNAALQRWLDNNNSAKDHKNHLAKFFCRFPEILNFIEETFSQPPYRNTKIFTLKLNGRQCRYQLNIEPIPGRNIKKQFWLITFIDKSNDDEFLQAKTWCKMAQKTAHDIKNPLSAILLTLQRLQILNHERGLQSTEEFDRYFARIIQRVDSLRCISKNFMKFVDNETLNLLSTNLNEYLSDTTNSIKPGLPPDIQLHFQNGADLPLVKIDQEAMMSVIENLISNAVNAMPDGGQITIATQLLQGMTFPNNGQQAKNCVLIEVLDTGIGISEVNREHLFEPDFTTSENSNGLGLAYVKKTIENHNGYIDVESELGAGSAFCIYLPVVE